MSGLSRIEGYAVISDDGMIAAADGQMPPSLMRTEDQRFYLNALDQVDVVVHGRHSAENPQSPARRRLIVTKLVRTLTADAALGNVFLWNPENVSFEDALQAFGLPVASVGILGGTDVFTPFLDRYDLFYVSRIEGVRLPGGRPVFRGVPERTPEDILVAHALEQHREVLRADGLTITAWTRKVERRQVP
jgi:hypothetical protein